MVGYDAPYEEIVATRVGLLRRDTLARHRLVTILAATGHAAGLVAVCAVRLVVVERVVELRGL